MPGTHNGTGIDESGGAQPFPEGEYHLRIIKAESGKVQTGKNEGCDKVTVTFRVAEGDYAGRQIGYHTIAFLPAMRNGEAVPGAGMALNFLKCIGEPYSKDGDYDWDERRWIGRVCKAVVVIEPDQKGNKWDRAKFINAPDQEYAEANARMAAGEAPPQEKGEPIPF